MLDETDTRLGDLDPKNKPMARARRIIDGKIAELESELAAWKFVRDVIDHELT